MIDFGDIRSCLIDFPQINENTVGYMLKLFDLYRDVIGDERYKEEVLPYIQKGLKVGNDFLTLEGLEIKKYNELIGLEGINLLCRESIRYQEHLYNVNKMCLGRDINMLAHIEKYRKFDISQCDRVALDASVLDYVCGTDFGYIKVFLPKKITFELGENSFDRYSFKRIIQSCIQRGAEEIDLVIYNLPLFFFTRQESLFDFIKKIEGSSPDLVINLYSRSYRDLDQSMYDLLLTSPLRLNILSEFSFSEDIRVIQHQIDNR